MAGMNAQQASCSACSQVCGGNQSAHSCAWIVLQEVFHQDNPSAKVPTYAILDDQSTDVFIADSLLKQLGVQGQEVNLEINMITRVNSVRTQKVNGLHIQDMDSLHKPIKVPFAYSQEKIPASQEDIATPEIARSWDCPPISSSYWRWIRIANWPKHPVRFPAFTAQIMSLGLKSTSLVGQSLVLCALTKEKTVQTVRQLTTSRYSEKTHRSSSTCQPATVPKRTMWYHLPQSTTPKILLHLSKLERRCN